MGTIGCRGNQSSDPICPNTVCSLSPIPMMLHIKFNQDWPTGIFKFDSVDDGRTADHWYTFSSPCEPSK